MRKVLKDSRRLAQKISGEKSVQKEATACAEVLRLEGAWCLWSGKEGWSGWRTAREGDEGFEARLD